ncbi:MAG: SgcJ/EcaC family oxidoreductase, partial [Terriglobales bacterium]
MLRNTTLIACLAVALLNVGCSNTTTSAPTPPPDTRAADMQAIKDFEAAWLKDANSKDAAKWASYFAEDGSALYPGMPTINGKDAIKTAMAPLFSDPNFTLTFQSTRTVASKGGDMVYSQGTYSMTMTNPKTKKPVTDKGKFLTVYAKQADGSWKSVADTYNSDSPM